MPYLAVLSVLLAMLFSWPALSLAYALRAGAPRRSLRSHASAIVRGLANPVMHYTATAGTVYTYSARMPDVSERVNVFALGIAGVSIVPIMLLFGVLTITAMDRARKQSALLDALFEQAPQSDALTRVDGRIVRVNREFARMFGRSPQDTIGRRLAALIAPDAAKAEEAIRKTVAQGQRVQGEGVYQRTDGARLDVAVLRAPVSMPGGEIAVYTIYRDIIEAKRAEEALRQSTERLQLLSRRQVEIQIRASRAVSRASRSY